MMVRYDQRRGLQPMNQRVGLRQPPVRGRFFPHAVEPDPAEWPVVREQLSELGVEEAEVTIPVAALGPAGVVARRAARPVIGMMPVQLGVIEEELDPLAPAFVRQLS